MYPLKSNSAVLRLGASLFAIAMVIATARAETAAGPAPAVPDLSPKDVSYGLEAKLPNLPHAYLCTAQGTSYGYFWWRHDMKVDDRKLDCISCRGAGGQYILIVPEPDLIIVITAHNKGMGTMLEAIPKRILPAFVRP